MFPDSNPSRGRRMTSAVLGRRGLWAGRRYGGGKASVRSQTSVGPTWCDFGALQGPSARFLPVPMRQAYHVVICSLTALSLSYRGGIGERMAEWRWTSPRILLPCSISPPIIPSGDVVCCSSRPKESPCRDRHGRWMQAEGSMIRSCRATPVDIGTGMMVRVDVVTISGPRRPTSQRATSPRAHEPTSPRAHEPTSPRAHEPTSPFTYSTHIHRPPLLLHSLRPHGSVCS